MSLFFLKPTHAPVKAYYAALAQFQLHGHTTEGNTRAAFADLLKKCASPYKWHLVEEFPFKGTGKQSLRADGAIFDNDLPILQGFWEAKDTNDDLDREIKSKVAKGYPLSNTLFQSPSRAVLYQDNRIALDCDLTKPGDLIEVLELFFNHKLADIPDWEEAVTKFAEKIPELATGVTKILEAEDKKNPAFRENFQSFAELCRQSINPDLTDDAIRKMLVQHLLTERIFRKVFNNQEFLSRNVIAAEIEKVIRSITARHFSRDEFLKPLDRFYTAIERAAESQTGYTEKQHFLNAVYEKFFQRFDRKQADTHGIVYTPQPIVDFMVRSVEEILHAEFGKSLSDSGVHILDPFTGTGNFITRIMREIKRGSLKQKYADELHCNEIMLLPYYIASMNIEHAYSEAMQEYRPFSGICLVDTFDTVGQSSLFSTENTKRIKAQMDAPIRIVIGNPPYNMGQVNENDGNKNRVYSAENSIDVRVARTYTAASKATLRNKLSDPYVKAFRWATDRIRDHGIVCYVTNNSFVDQLAFDGMREHLMRDYSKIYVLDLGGNVRLNPKLSGTVHNVFGIQVGVAITLLIRHNENDTQKAAEVFYARMPEDWRRTQKYSQLDDWKAVGEVVWKQVKPDARNTWLTEGQHSDFAKMIPLGDKGTKGTWETEGVFRLFSLGMISNRDAYVWNWSASQLNQIMQSSVTQYLATLHRYAAIKEPRPEPASFIDTSDATIKWTRQTIVSLGRLEESEFVDSCIRKGNYRPFATRAVYFQDFWNEEQYQQNLLFPIAEVGNSAICWNASPNVGGPYCLASNLVPDLHFTGDTQTFSFYTYDRHGGDKQENITDWALAEFRTHYADKKITKWDIFHGTYAVLHHPEYRTRYAANLKRELPRIPFPPEFHAFAAAGQKLMTLHIDYEKQSEYQLEQIEDPKAEVSFRVERMKLSKDKSELRYNDFLLLRGIPAAAYDYRLGNRSALEWVIDQYRVSTDPRSGIVNDPNRADDDHYILRLIGQVITVSLETQKLIATLPSLNFGK
jgi:predicted helicase